MNKSDVPTATTLAATSGFLVDCVRRVGRSAIRFYMLLISPLKPPCCRFYPTCSQYAVEAINQFGLVRGCWLTLTRILRCHPLCESGVDFIPERFTWIPRRNPIDYHSNKSTKKSENNGIHGTV